MAAPRTGTCTPWATVADVCSPCDDYTFPAGLLDDSLQIASNVLFRLSGRQFPGECEATVRPCARHVAWGDRSWARALDVEYRDIAARTLDGSISTCSCNRSRSCGCARLSEITLGGYPLVEITEVKVDGAILDPSTYRIDDYRWLVRLDDADGTNPGWPCCQTLTADPDTDEDTFEVSFVYGTDPPPEGVRAAAVLGCELALACQPETIGQCRLPRRLTEIVRQGVTMAMVEPRTFLEDGLTGLVEVDLFLQSVNPKRIDRRARILSPDVGRRVRRADT